jgi:uncharacterized protein with ATP-grasp and redox domains
VNNFFLVNRQASDLPPPLRGTDPDSFTHQTITERWPRILRRVIDENDYPARINDRIRALIDDLPDAPIRLLDDPGAPDEALWNERIEPYRGQSWLEAPWFFGETYLYRRLLEATGYFQPGPGRHNDPFTEQKRRGYDQSVDGIRTLAQARATALDEKGGQREELVRLLKTALWGNQADLSMWGAGEESPDHLGTGDEEAHLLADDTTAVLDHLDALNRPARIDVWADNAGFELVTDLALADGLLTTGLAAPVVLHVKAHPTFVSDATVGDVDSTLDRLAAGDHDATRALAERLHDALKTGRLQLRDPLTWTSPLRARDFPANVNAELARADLVISKGDANYRRLLGDRHWTFTTPFAEITSYFPAPLLALRTLKAEIACGLAPERVDRLDDTHPDWLTSGEWGVIQFAAGADA